MTSSPTATRNTPSSSNSRHYFRSDLVADRKQYGGRRRSPGTNDARDDDVAEPEAVSRSRRTAELCTVKPEMTSGQSPDKDGGSFARAAGDAESGDNWAG